MTTAMLYARTSTDEQVNGMDAQRERLIAEAERRGWTYEVHTEHRSGKSMTRAARPEFDIVLTRLDKLGRNGVLVVTKLDRLSRSVVDFGAVLRRAERRGWAIVVLDLGNGAVLDTSDPFGKFGATVMMAAAELERGLIGMRTREGLAVVKARGTKLGHPSRVPTDVRARILTARAGGMSWRTIADGLNHDGVPSPGAGSPTGHGKANTRWHPNSVHRIYDQEVLAS